MEITYMKTADLIPYENNPRKNDGAVEFVANSIEEFGFKVPIVIDKENVVVAGHTRLKAAELLGLEEVPCIIADDLSEKQIKAFRIADNKTAEKSIWDSGRLGIEISDILKDFDMTEFGFGDFELTILTEDYDPEPYDDELVKEYSGHEQEFLAKQKIIIVYEEGQEGIVKDLLGIESIDKVVYDIAEIISGN